MGFGMEAMAELPGHIGRYEVKRAIGQGAMGVVFLAEDPLLKRRVAIKVVRATGEEREQALERFKHEAEISAQLNHPNIVTVYDVGEEPSLGPFMAMEFVDGNSLGRFIRDNTLELETKFGILIQAMRALRAAHRHAIVHRDVKPDNILVSEDGRVKLMDFGIAKTMAPRPEGAGEFLGSPAYSSPELLRGAEPTPSSDRYAFAVSAFELLTGQLPHPGANVAAVGVYTVDLTYFIPVAADQISLIGAVYELRLIGLKVRERELQARVAEAVARVRVLSGMLPICASCKKVRDDKGYWNQIETYIRQHSDTQISHGLCPDCVRKLYPEFSDEVLRPGDAPAPFPDQILKR